MVKLDVDTVPTVPEAPPGPVQTEVWIPRRRIRDRQRSRCRLPLPSGTGLLPRARRRRKVRSPHTSAQRPRSIDFFCSSAIAVPLAGVAARRWLPRRTSQA